MTNEAMSPSRRRMIEDMTIRKLAPKTQQGYIRTIKNFAVFLGRSPETASLEEIRASSCILPRTANIRPFSDAGPPVRAPSFCKRPASENLVWGNCCQA